MWPNELALMLIELFGVTGDDRGIVVVAVLFLYFASLALVAGAVVFIAKDMGWIK